MSQVHSQMPAGPLPTLLTKTAQDPQPWATVQLEGKGLAGEPRASSTSHGTFKRCVFRKIKSSKDSDELRQASLQVTLLRGKIWDSVNPKLNGSRPIDTRSPTYVQTPLRGNKHGLLGEGGRGSGVRTALFGF